jgi:hypothetical protein
MTLNTKEIGLQPQNLGFRSLLSFVGNEKSLRRAFWNRRRNRVQNLLDGGTSEEEERAALDVLLKADSGAECRHYIRHFGWDRLDDELIEEQVTRWAQHTGLRHAQDADIVARFVRWSVGATTDVPVNDQVTRYREIWNSLSLVRRRQIAAWLIREREALIAAGARMEFAGRPNGLESLRALVAVATDDQAVVSEDLHFVRWQAHYSVRFAEQLREGQVRLLVTTLMDLVDPSLANVRRHALLDLYQRVFLRTVGAIREVIGILGSTDQRQRFERFLEMRREFVDAFPATQPSEGLIAQLANAIGAAAESIQGISAALNEVADRISSITFAGLLNELEDDNARAAINALGRADVLDALPLGMRIELCRRCLVGTTDDDDETAINRVLRNTWRDSLFERYLLVSALTWEALSFSIDGDESDALEEMLSNV